jgi:hypothetical protein
MGYKGRKTMWSTILGIALVALVVWATITTLADAWRYRYMPLYLKALGYLLVAVFGAGLFLGIPLFGGGRMPTFLLWIGVILANFPALFYRKDMEARGIKTRGLSWRPRS